MRTHTHAHASRAEEEGGRRDNGAAGWCAADVSPKPGLPQLLVQSLFTLFPRKQYLFSGFDNH